MNSRSLYIIAAIIVVVLVLSPLPVRQDLGWVDAVSGSQKQQTVWQFGMATTPVVTVSPLEERFRSLGLQWEHDWRNVEGTYRDVFGRSRGHAHGQAPPIYTLSMHSDLQRDFVDASSDDEIREFFRIMTTGTDEEQEAAAEAAGWKALRSRR